jgi:hypothetical protein
MSLSLSLITSKDLLAKQAERQDGTLTLVPSAQLWRGKVDVCTFRDIAEFADFLPTLRTTQALMYGVPRDGRSSNIVTQAMLEQRPGLMNTIARTNRHFIWLRSSGIMFLDYDPPKGGEALSREALVAALRTAVPELASTPLLWWPSSSSHIHDEEGRDLTGLRGQRLYLAVADATDIPRLGKQIETRLWAAGHGRFDISKSGALLARTLVDTSVWQPSRLDFAAGAHCGPGLSQRRGLPILIPGEK